MNVKMISNILQNVMCYLVIGILRISYNIVENGLEEISSIWFGQKKYLGLYLCIKYVWGKTFLKELDVQSGNKILKFKFGFL